MRAERKPTGRQAVARMLRTEVRPIPSRCVFSEWLSLSAFSDPICSRPGGDCQPTAGEDRPEEQQDQPGGKPPVEGGEAGESLARAGVGVRECLGLLRPG